MIILKENYEKLLPVFNNSPVLKEIEPLSQNLSDLAAAGLDAFHYIQNKNNADSTWIKNTDTVLEKSLISYGKVKIAIVSGIKKLVQAVKLNTN